MPGRVSCPWFVGRAAELALLTRALDDVGRGACRAVLIGGDAGIGKSRLATELGGRATTAGADVLVGACLDLADGGAPYAAVHDVLVQIAPGKPVAGDPSDELLDLLRRRTVERPVVLVLEDVHWSDRSTQSLLVRLAAGPALPHLLVLATYRSDDALPRGHPLRRTLAELDRAERVEHIRLDGFGPAELHAQLEGILGGCPDDATARAVLERSDGIPLLAEELAAAAASGGELSIGMHELLLSRFDRLSPPTREVLRVAAIGGRRVGHGLLAEVCEDGERALSTALREAVSHHVLVVDGDHYRFRHALLHDAITGDVLPGERLRIHAAFATAIEARPDLVDGQPWAPLVHHWTGARRAGPALRAAIEAASHAESGYARHEAQRYWDVAVEMWDGAIAELGADELPLTRDELLHRAADNASRAGDVGLAAELVEVALASVDARVEPARAALLHERRGWCLLQAGRPADAMAAYEHAVALVPSRPPTVARARVLAAYADALERAGDAAAAPTAEQAITAAIAAASPADEGHARHTLGACLLDRRDQSAGLAQLERALALAETGGDVADAVGIHRHMWRELVSAGRAGELVEQATSGAEQARRRAMPVLAGVLDGLAAGYCHELGRWDDADVLIARIDPDGLPGIVRLLVGGLLDVDRGRLDAAGDALETVRGLTYGLRDGRIDGLLYRGLAERALWRDRPVDASALVDDGLDRTTDAEMAAWLALVGLRATADGDTSAAAARVGVLHSMVERAHGGREVEAIAATGDAEASRVGGRSDPEAWASASSLWRRLGFPLPLVHTNWRHAEAMLAAGGSREAGAAVLTEAWTIADGLGASGWRSVVEAAARRARVSVGATTRAPAPSADRFGLTSRELEVLGLLGTGRTNRQLGAELFISEKTVRVHVSHILTKLGAATRTEAVDVAHRHGLL